MATVAVAWTQVLHSATYGLLLIQWNLTDTLVLPSHIALLHCFLFLFGITQCGWHLENLFSVIDWFKMLSRHPRLSLSFGMVASPATHPTVCNLKYIPSLTGLPPSSWSSGVPPQKLENARYFALSSSDLSKECVVLKHATHRPSCVYRSIWPAA